MPAHVNRTQCSASRAVAALVVLLGARGMAAEPCSLADGKPWREYQTQHLVIDVAGSDREPAKLVAAFEDLHAAVLATLIAEPVEIPGRVRVILLPHERDLID